MSELICTVCPKGCRLRVEESNDYAVAGAGCEKGIAYGRSECINPMRTLTSTVRLEGAALRRCPVRTSGAIPKKRLFEAMDALDAVTLHAPVKVGQVVIRDLLGTGCDLIVTRSIEGDGT